jgi:hypothetical protein
MGYAVGYLLIGLLLGWAWNRVEFARTGLGGTRASFAAFFLAWPLVALCAIAVAAIWARKFDDAYRCEEPAPHGDQAPAAAPPDPPALTGRAAAH